MRSARETMNRLFPRLYDGLRRAKRAAIMWKFRRAYPKTRLFYPSATRKRYAQDDQDHIIYHGLFEGKHDGIFCDVGGNHPLNLNNTRYFEELGWSGFVFEPLPYMQALWEEHRQAKFFPYAASDQEGEVTFSVVKDATGWEDMLSYVKATRDIEYKYEVEEMTVRTRALMDVFEEEGITHIDFMSIDVEGHELNVIHGIDFQKVDITVLTIENNPPEQFIYGSDVLRETMARNGYLLWGRIVGLDDIYVKAGALV